LSRYPQSNKGKMTSTHQDCKARFRNLQKLYSYYFYFTMAICVVLALALLLSLFSIIKVNSVVGILIAILTIVVFGPPCLYLRSKNKNYFLKTPDYFSEKTFKVIRNTSIVLFVLVFALGILFYPYAPIKLGLGTFIDKVGREYSYREYIGFEKWELSFWFSWSIFALQNLIFLPISDGKTHKWWKF
jgi:hypothetical protein